MEMEELYQLYPYAVPEWASCLKHSPKQRVKLSYLNTPIHKWNLPDVPGDCTIHIKRDDMTGAELSGNKVRGLQFFFAEALAQQCQHVVTGGGPQSGHCRAVSLTCRALGLTPHVVIEGVDKVSDLGTMGNTLMYRLAGSNIYLSPTGEDYTQFQQRVRKMAEYISMKYEAPCYCVPVGGSAVQGVFGFISAFDELLTQGLQDRFDDIVVTIATGGTATGLAVGNYLTGSKLRIHAVTIGLSEQLLTEKIDALLDDLGLTDVRTGDIMDIIEGYIGERYGTASDSVLDFITSVSSSTGVLLDPYYTGKGTLGMVSELTARPERFKGKRILFYHTGWMFGLFNGEMDRVLDNAASPTNNICLWPDIDTSPL